MWYMQALLPDRERHFSRSRQRLERFRTGNSPELVSAHAPTDGARGTEFGMSETKDPGEKKLSVGKLTLKPRTETGVVRQSFSHGRSKQVVVEKVKRRSIGGAVEVKAEPAPAEPVRKPAAASNPRQRR